MTSALEPTVPPGPDEQALAASLEPTGEPLPDIVSGATLRGRYALERVLGTGGSSVVFAAIDRHRADSRGVQGRIAVKVLRKESRSNEACVYRLAREFRQMQRLTHANIARVFDIDNDRGVWFLTMELLQGCTLQQRLKDSLTATAAFEILSECCAALTHAHELGITHGDLKPSNIFIVAGGSVRLLDFGSVPDRDEWQQASEAGYRYAATPQYASPQILLNERAEPRDDVFSFACVAYEMLSGGEHPFGRISSLEARARDMRPPYVRRMQPRHYSVLALALSWEREQRPATVRELLHALMACDLAHLPAMPHRPAIVAAIATATGSAGALMGPPAEKRGDTIDAKTQRSEPDVAAQAPVTTTNDKSGGAPLAMLTTSTVWIGDAAQQRLGYSAEAVTPLGMAIAESVQSGMTAAGRRRSASFVALLIIGVAIYLVSNRDNSPRRAISPAPAVVAPAAPAPRIDQPAALAAAPAAMPAPATDISPAPVPQVAATPIRPTPRASAPEATLSLQARHVAVPFGQTLAVLTLERKPPLDATARVRWRTVEGSAKAGVHYEGVRGQTVRFAEGQRVRSLFIPIRDNEGAAAARPPRSFTVQLEALDESAVGPINRAQVTIAGIP